MMLSCWVGSRAVGLRMVLLASTLGVASSIGPAHALGPSVGVPYRVSAASRVCPSRGHAVTMTVADAFADGGRRRVWVYRPAVPDSATLPVLYLLHGLPGSSDDFYNSGIAYDLDRAMCRGAAPFVVAAPDGSTPSTFDNEWADDAAGRFKLESLITGRLIGAVEGAHRRTRHYRALGGFSMGGFAAASIAERHPSEYGQFAAVSGYFHIDDPDHVFGDQAAQHDPDLLAPQASSMRVFLGDGDQQTDPSSYGETQRYAQSLIGSGQQIDEVVVHGDHSLATFRALVPSLTAWLESGWH